MHRILIGPVRDVIFSVWFSCQLGSIGSCGYEPSLEGSVIFGVIHESLKTYVNNLLASTIGVLLLQTREQSWRHGNLVLCRPRAKLCPLARRTYFSGWRAVSHADLVWKSRADLESALGVPFGGILVENRPDPENLSNFPSLRSVRVCLELLAVPSPDRRRRPAGDWLGDGGRPGRHQTAPSSEKAAPGAAPPAAPGQHHQQHHQRHRQQHLPATPTVGRI